MEYKFINGWKFPEYESRLCAINEQGDSIYVGLSSVERSLGYVKKFGTALDIGANVGLIAVPLAKKFKKVVAIECIPTTYECLVYNTANYPHVTCHNQAVSNKLGSITVSIPKTQGQYVSSGWATISEERMNKFEDMDRLDVSTLTIDSLNLQELDYVKIDVEQAEMMVMQGAEQTLKKFKPVIQFENKRGENNHVIVWLEERGFQIAPGTKRKSSEITMVDSLYQS